MRSIGQKKNKNEGGENSFHVPKIGKSLSGKFCPGQRFHPFVCFQECTGKALLPVLKQNLIPMKTRSTLLAGILLTGFFTHALKAQNSFPSSGAAGIGTTTPDASSIIEIKSTTQGALIPRMT